MRSYIDFLNIYVILLSDFRLASIIYEDFDILFKTDLKNINKIYGDQIHISVRGKTFQVNYLGDKNNITQELKLLIFILSHYQSSELSGILSEIETSNIKPDIKEELHRFFYLVQESYLEDNKHLEKEIEYYKEKSFLIYYVFLSIFKCFRGDKNLLDSVKYTTILINKYPNFSFLYLYRVRNLFLHYYQKVIGYHNFTQIITEDKNKILHSKFMKQIFQDIYKARNINPSNYISDLFEGNILLYLRDKRGVDMLLSIKGKITQDTFDEYVYDWIGNYYLSLGDYQNAEYYYKDLSSNRSFKYYRKIIPILILSGNVGALQNIFIELLQKNYKILLFCRSRDMSIDNNLFFSGSQLNNSDINIPLDMDKNDFFSILNSLSHSDTVPMSFIGDVIPHMRKDYNKYFLHDTDISIIFKNQEDEQ